MPERYRTKPSVEKNNRTRNQTSSTGYAVPRLTHGHIKINQKSLGGGSSVTRLGGRVLVVNNSLTRLGGLGAAAQKQK